MQYYKYHQVTKESSTFELAKGLHYWTVKVKTIKSGCILYFLVNDIVQILSSSNISKPNFRPTDTCIKLPSHSAEDKLDNNKFKSLTSSCWDFLWHLINSLDLENNCFYIFLFIILFFSVFCFSILSCFG